jgi:hypothetical protein
MTIQNAKIPGATKNRPERTVEARSRKNGDAYMVNHPSQIILRRAVVMPIAGVNQNMVAAGLSSPIFLFFMSSCVRLQRRPPHALAVITSKNPGRTKAVSEATIRITPPKMRRMTTTSRSENTSRRKKNAKDNTKMSEDDLHIAADNQLNYMSRFET